MKYILLTLVYIVLLYDAKGEEILDNNLPRLSYNSSLKDIGEYETRVNFWIGNPQRLNILSERQLIQLCMQIGATPAKSEMSNQIWLRLRESDTKLMGLIVASMARCIDPRIDVDRSMNAYLPYEDIASPSEVNNAEKRKAYETEVQTAYAQNRLEEDQKVIRKQLDILVFCVSAYFEAAYRNKTEVIQMATPILQSSGVNPDLLARILMHNDS